jgi:two-component system capsular synthesis response regulator RcsB
MPKGLRVLLADDHPLLLAGVAEIVRRSDLASHIAQAENASAVVAHLETRLCDVLITDYSMPDPQYGDGLQMLSYLRRRFPALPIVVLTLIDNPAVLRTILRLGIYTIVSKKDPAPLILTALQAARLGLPYKSPAMATAMAVAIRRQAPHGTARLSKRESEVLRLYAEGLSVTQIGVRLNRSVKTVSGQKKSAFNKLGIGHDADLFRYAFDSGLCSAARAPLPKPAGVTRVQLKA